MVWRWISPDGACCDFNTEVFARQLEKASPGSRVVELAPVDPLERAVVEAAVAYYRMLPLYESALNPHTEAHARHRMLCCAIAALLEEKEGA